MKRHHRFRRREQQRKVNYRQKLKFYLIISEGKKTEKYYFDGLREDLPQHVLESYEIEVRGAGMNTLSLIREARRLQMEATKLGRPYDEIWAVFDKDSFSQFNDAINTAGEGTPCIKCAWSNESFELWYILHFAYLESQISRNDYEHLINKHISKAKNKEFKYQKNNKEMYNLLCKYGNVFKAIEWAKKLSSKCTGKDYAKHNPATLVGVLVEKLLKLNPDYEKIKNSQLRINSYQKKRSHL